MGIKRGPERRGRGDNIFSLASLVRLILIDILPGYPHTKQPTHMGRSGPSHGYLKMQKGKGQE